MTLFQIFVIILILVVVYKSFVRFVKKELSVYLLIFWLALWLGLIFVIVYPKIINRLADLFGVGRGVDLVIYITLFSVIYTLFRINLRLNKIEKHLTQIVRKIAVNNYVDKNE